MRLAATLLTIAATLTLSPAAMAGPDLSRSITTGVKRGAAAFGGIYSVGGMSAAAEAVKGCYGSLKAQAAGKLAECAALDIVSANVDQQAVHSLGVPSYEFFSGEGPEKRINAGIRKIGLKKAVFDRSFVPALNSALANYMPE